MPFPWTAESISNRLGISIAVFRERLAESHIARIREAGIARIELSISKERVDFRSTDHAVEIRSACERHDVQVVSVHGPFDLPYQSDDAGDRAHLMDTSLQAIRFAADMGASVYVAHFGHRDACRRNVADLLRETDDLDIVLTTENQGGQSLIPYIDVVTEFAADRFGLTVDIGHPRDDDHRNPFVKHDTARRTLAQCGSCVSHVHLHETFDLDRQPDHRPPMHVDGIIEWGELFLALDDIGYAGELVFEDGRGEDPDSWIRHTADFPRAFIEKYAATT